MSDLHLARELAEMMRPDMPTDVEDDRVMTAAGGKVVWPARLSTNSDLQFLHQRTTVTALFVTTTEDFPLTDGINRFNYRITALDGATTRHFAQGLILIKKISGVATLVGGGDIVRLEWDQGLSLVWSASGANLRLTLTPATIIVAEVYLQKTD